MLAFAQSIPAQLKLRRTDPAITEATGPTTEKWLLRKACADLLPVDLVWRQKAQFDEELGDRGGAAAGAADPDGRQGRDRAAA